MSVFVYSMRPRIIQRYVAILRRCVDLLGGSEGVVELSSSGYRRLWVFMCSRDLNTTRAEGEMTEYSRCHLWRMPVHRTKSKPTTIVHAVKPNQITCPVLGEEHPRGYKTYYLVQMMPSDLRNKS